MNKKIIGLIAVFLIILTGCNDDSVKNNKPTIITTVYPVSYITEQIVQDTANVESVYPEGADIHEYELTTKDIQNILESDYLFAISEQIESFIPTIEQSVKDGQSQVSILKIADNKIITDQIKDNQYYDKEEGIIQNYHFWTSPKKSLLVSEVIYNDLIQQFPENAELYTQNYNTLKDKLQKLDEQYSQINNEQIFYTTHDAYYWLVQDYNIDIRAIQGADEHHEVSTKEIQQIVDSINENNIQTIYAEKNDKENKLIKTISEQTSSDIKYLNNFETQIEGEDYIQGLTNNLEEFK